MMAAALGIDVGTTDTKAVITDQQGRVLAVGRGPTRWDHAPEGGAQIAPDALLAGVVSAMAEALDACPQVDRVTGIGVTGMAEAGVLLAGNGSVQSWPVIAWFDPRGWAEMAALDPALRAAIPARTGLPASPLATFAKLAWMRASLGVTLADATWLNVPEFVVYALGGAAVTEPSLASRTALLDQDDLTVFEPALAALDASAQLLPELVVAGVAVGTVAEQITARRSGGRQLELPAPLRGATLTVAGHDHPVASLAAGALGPDDLFDSCGTAEALLRATPRIVRPEERVRLAEHNVTQGAHVLPGRRLLLGGTRGGLLLRRTLALLGADSPAAREALDAATPLGEVQLDVRVDGGALDEQGMQITLHGDEVSPPMVWRAALEAGAEQAEQLVALFEEVAGPAKSMIAAGGWTKSAAYRAVKQRRFPGVRFAEVDQAGGLAAAAIGAFAASDERDPGAIAPWIEEFVSARG